MTSPARARVLAGSDALDEVDGLDELLELVGAPVTARRPWLAVCVRRGDHDPCVVVVEDEGGLAAVAPLATRKRRTHTEVVVIGHGRSDRACLAARDPAAAAALADAVVTAASEWRRPWRLRIEQLPDDDPVSRALSARLRSAAIVEGEPCPVLPLDRGRDAEAYEGPKFRKQVRAGRNRLKTDERACDIVRLTDATDVQAALDEVVEVHRHRDHELGRRSDVDDEDGLALWRELVAGHAQRGELELVLLRIDGALAAYGVVFVDGFAYRIWDARIASAFGRYAPGHLLAQGLLHAALARDTITCFDWGRGTEPYKRLLAPDLEERRNLLAWSSSWAGRVLELPGNLRRRIATFADRHQSVRRAWVWLKQRTVAR